MAKCIRCETEAIAAYHGTPFCGEHFPFVVLAFSKMSLPTRNFSSTYIPPEDVKPDVVTGGE
jgi:hypothetical protein